MNVLAIVYVLYLLISVSIIHLMARILAKTSTHFLLEVFPGKHDLVLRIDRVLIASFFLANVGFVVSILPAYAPNLTAGQAIAMLLDKLGAAVLFVGFTLFLGLWIFARMRRFTAPDSNPR